MLKHASFLTRLEALQGHTKVLIALACALIPVLVLGLVVYSHLWLQHDPLAWSALLFLALSAVLTVVVGFLMHRAIFRPLHAIIAAVKEQAAGNFSRAVPCTSYANELGDLARNVDVLRSQAGELELQRWVKSNTADISAEIQQATSMVQLAQQFLSHIAPLINLGHGALYHHDDRQSCLRMLGGYAIVHRKQFIQTFALGQGFVGQCGLEQTPILITEPPEDYLPIGTGMGESPPKLLAFYPVERNGKLLAVLELVSFSPFDAGAQALIGALLPVLATSLEILQRTQKSLEQ